MMNTNLFSQISLVTVALGAATQLAAQQICSTAIERTRPNSRYEVVLSVTPAGNEVRDKVTGLIWKRCLEGALWNGTTCAGSASTFTWTNALERARTATATTASPVTSWRLPNMKELLSLEETACDNPSINATWFPNHPISDPFNAPTGDVWSASPYANNASNAWSISFGSGFGYVGNGKGSALSVRLVRSGH